MKSLSVTSIDLGRFMAERNSVPFRATGSCMYPNIRSGDLLTIQPCAISDIKVGNIAVCRSSGFLFAHRVIKKGKNRERSFIVTRSDRNRTGNDLPVYADDFLGIVTAINRNGKSINIDMLNHSVYLRRYHDLSGALIVVINDLKKHLINGVDLSVKSWPGRVLTRLWMKNVCSRIRYSVRIPFNESLGDTVYKEIDPDLFNPDDRPNGKRINRWTLTLHLNGATDPVAWIVLTRNLAETISWHVECSHVRIRYRGGDFHEKLVARAQSIVGSSFQ